MYKRIETTIGGRCSLGDGCPFNVEIIDSICVLHHLGDVHERCPDERTSVQVEITLKDAPTRKELLDALQNYVDADYYADGDGNGGIGGGGGGASNGYGGGAGGGSARIAGGTGANAQNIVNTGDGGANTGGGGGGGTFYGSSGAQGGLGGSGIVIVRYPL